MDVKVIWSKQGKTLIEWFESDDYHRGIIPDNLVINNQVDDAALSLAIPQGVDWAFVLAGAIRPIIPEDVARELHKHGIWTLEDMRSNPKAVHGAILSAYGMTFNRLIQLTEQYNREVTGGKQ